ncbi:TPA: hypothetical protein JLS63_005032 [Escherichia coli]|nr:hypothetical protein [Escherichia coli]
MAKQIIEPGFQLSTPGYTDEVSERRYGIRFSESFCVTTSGTITLANVQKECLFEETIVDICAEINGYPLVIYFSHPERRVPVSLKVPDNKQCGVLEIDLSRTRELFLSKNATSDRFDDVLKTFIEGDNHSKKWIFHPRKHSTMCRARTRLEKRITNWRPPQERTKIRKNPYVRFEPGREHYYECLICKTKWSAYEYEKPVCPVCRIHLYSRQIY